MAKMLKAHLVSLIEMQPLYAPQIEASMCLKDKADIREDKGKYKIQMEDTKNITAFNTETLALVNRIIKRYPQGRQKSALLPVLHIAQSENSGWLSSEVMDYVATLLDIQPIEVYEVASFYSMFNLQPVGNCVIEVCRTGPCWLKGADEIVAHYETRLGIKVGETTADGKFTLKTVECLAACGNAPVLQVGTEYHENLTIQKADELLDKWQAENKISHTNPYL